MEKINSHRDLNVYQLAFKTAVEIEAVILHFPSYEKYSLCDQIRRSCRSVCANLAEAYRKRRYPKNFVSKLSDCESEAGETQVWLEFALNFNYIDQETFDRLDDKYEHIMAMIINMSNNPNKWKL